MGNSMRDYLMDKAMKRNNQNMDMTRNYPRYDSRQYDYAMHNDRRNDYNMDYRNDRMDYRNDRYERDMAPFTPDENRYYNRMAGRDYADYNKEKQRYEDDLYEWTNKLKRKDRFNIGKEEVLKRARNMGVKFDKYSEEEFYAVYLMEISDHKTASNDYNFYINMAKEWLEDDDVASKGSKKICKYLYEIVLEDE